MPWAENVSVQSMLLNRATVIPWLTGIGVLLAGITDWLQGVAPDGIVSTPSSVGLALFVVATIGAVACSVVATQRSADAADRTMQFASIALAAIAAAIGDPTYAVLLFAVPLIDLARRRNDAGRVRIIVGVFLLAAALVAVEKSSWAGNDLEATLIVFIALVITTMFGDTLGRLDDAHRSETERARVDERQHLARELHDSVGHSLLASSIQLRNAEALWERQPEAARRSIELAGRAVDEALVDTRFAVDTIRTQGDPFDLEEALTELVQRIESPQLAVSLSIGDDVGQVDQVSQVTLYRVAQEALSNVVRHAAATEVEVSHQIADGAARLRVRDDGQGFDPGDGTHNGLRSLTERLVRVGGSLDVESAHGQGTSVLATVGLDR